MRKLMYLSFLLLLVGCADSPTKLWVLNSATVRENLGTNGAGQPSWALDEDSGTLRSVRFCSTPSVWKGLHGDFYLEHYDEDKAALRPACDELVKVVRDFKELK